MRSRRRRRRILSIIGAGILAVAIISVLILTNKPEKEVTNEVIDVSLHNEKEQTSC
mgnify:FL=1